jgi:HEAT repeat protein
MIERIEEALKELMADPAAPVREAAAGAMDKTRAKRSLEAFRERIRGGSQEDKIRAVQAAEEIGGAEGISLLLEALSDGTEEIRGAAVLGLASHPTPAVLKALWEMVPKEKGVVLGNLIEALGASGRKELGPHLEKYLGHPDPEVRAKAALAGSRLAEAAGWEKILALRSDPDPEVRAAVAMGLGNWTSSRG